VYQLEGNEKQLLKGNNIIIVVVVFDCSRVRSRLPQCNFLVFGAHTCMLSRLLVIPAGLV